MGKNKSKTLFGFSGLVSRFTVAGGGDSRFVFVPSPGCWRRLREIEFVSPGGTLRLKRSSKKLLQRKKKGVGAQFYRDSADARFFADSRHRGRIIDMLGCADSPHFKKGLFEEIRREVAEEFSIPEYVKNKGLVETITGRSPKELKPVLTKAEVAKLEFVLVRTKTRTPIHSREYKLHTAYLFRYIFVCHAIVPDRKMFKKIVDHPLTLALSENQVLQSAIRQGRNVSIRFGH